MRKKEEKLLFSVFKLQFGVNENMYMIVSGKIYFNINDFM